MRRQASLILKSDGWVPARKPPDVPTAHRREVEDALVCGLLLGYCLGAFVVTAFICLVVLIT